MTNRRFLILTQYYPPEVGAAQVRLSSMAHQLQDLGHDVAVVTALPNYPTGRIHADYRRRFRVREMRDDVDVTRVWMYASQGRGVKRLISYLSFTMTSMLGLMGTKRPDYVFVESPPLFLAVTAALFSRLRRAKLIVNVSDLWPDAAVDLGVLKPGPGLRFAHWLERWCYARASVVTAVTYGIAAAIADGRAPADKLRMLPNGVDTDLFRPDGGRRSTLEELGIDGQHLFAFTGNLGYAQGLDTVVRAAHLAAKSEPGITLAFLGDGSDRPALRHLVTELGAFNVRFIDPVPLERVAEVLPLTTAVIVSLRDLPTNQGARPSKIFPALASGRPILYAGPGEGAELVAQADAGVIVDNDDVEAIAEAMLRLVRDPQQGDRLGRNGRALAESEYGWRPIVEAWTDQLPS